MYPRHLWANSHNNRYHPHTHNDKRGVSKTEFRVCYILYLVYLFYV